MVSSVAPLVLFDIDDPTVGTARRAVLNAHRSTDVAARSTSTTARTAVCGEYPNEGLFGAPF